MEPAATPPKKRKGKKAFIILGALAVAALVGYFGYQWWTRGKISDDNAQVDADVVMVSSQVPGVVANVYVSDHQRVDKGAKILDLDITDLELKFEQATADLAAAKAAADKADAQVEITRANASGGRSSAQAGITEQGAAVRSADAQIQSAQAAVKSAQANFNKQASDLKRTQQLKAAGAVTDVQVDAAQQAYDMSQAALDAARAQLTSAKQAKALAQARVAEAKGGAQKSDTVDAQVKSAQADADLAHAKYDSAKVALAVAQRAKDQATIFAPVAGTVSKLAVHPGQSVTPNAPLVVVVPDETYVIANLKESEIGKIAVNQKVDIEVDAYGDRTFHGVVTAIAGATGARFSLLPPDNATGNFVKVVQRVPVKITWVDLPKDVAMRPGLSAEVVIHVPD
jgi:membrane fusion protein (multidrug efflux system)